MIAEHAKTDPALKPAKMPDVTKGVADYLRVPLEQVEPRRTDVEAITELRVGMHLANAAMAALKAGPPSSPAPAAAPSRSTAPAAEHALPMAEQDDKAMETAQAEGDALPMAEQDDKAKETAEGPPTEQDKETEQPASGAAAPMAGQPVHSALARDLAPPPKTKSVENPAFKGLPSRPRCRQCNSLLSDGRCLDPDCGKDQGDAEK